MPVGATRETWILPVSSWPSRVYSKATRHPGWGLCRWQDFLRSPCHQPAGDTVRRWVGGSWGWRRPCSGWLVTTASWHPRQERLHFGRDTQKKRSMRRPQKCQNRPAAPAVPLFFPWCFPVQREQWPTGRRSASERGASCVRLNLPAARPLSCPWALFSVLMYYLRPVESRTLLPLLAAPSAVSSLSVILNKLFLVLSFPSH